MLPMLRTVAARSVPRDMSTDTDQPPDTETSTVLNKQFPSWLLILIFLVLLFYVELAGRLSNARRKWYYIAMGVPNFCIPWLVDYPDTPPMLTVCVFAFVLGPTCGIAKMDYDELSPSPVFYAIVGIIGFAGAAAFSAISPKAHVVNSISAYLLLGMTASMVICRKALIAYRALQRSG